MAILFANYAKTALASGLSTTQNIIYLAAGTGSLFPTPSGGDYFALALSNTAGTKQEVVNCNYRSGDTLTVIRAQEGTVANTWSAGDLIENGPTAGTMQALQQSVSTNPITLTLVNNGMQQWGPTSSYNLVVDPTRIQARFDGAVTGLVLNPLGGPVSTQHNTMDDGSGNALVTGTFSGNGSNYLNGPTTASSLSATSLTVNGTSNMNGPVNMNGAVVATNPIVCAPAVASNEAVTLSQFSNSAADPGYMRFPNGMIMQWGLSTASSLGSSVAFPIPFPSSVLSITLGLIDFPGIQPVGVSSVTTSNFILSAGTNSTIYSVYWMAIGY